MPVSVLKSASTSSQHVSEVAAAIETIANNLPFSNKNVDYNTRVKIATALVYKVFTNNKRLNAKSVTNRNHFLRTAEKLIADAKTPRREAVGLIDQNTGLQKTYPVINQDTTQKSYTKTTAAPNAKDIVEPDPSSYSNRKEYIQLLINAGYGLAAATELANIRYGPTNSTVGGTTVQNRNAEGGRTKITTWTPAEGRIPLKSASTEVPSWVVSTGMEAEYTQYMRNAPINTKSANISSVPVEYFGESIASILERKQRNKEEAREARHTASVKSAGISGKPKWMSSLSMFDEVG